MKRRLLVPIVFAGVALASGVATANPQYWRDNGLLLEVSADPRDGRDLVNVDPTRADSLELIALHDTVALRGMTLHFADGRAVSRTMGFMQPGQPVRIDLPENCAPITSVELDYGNPAYRRYDRTPARLQIVPHVAPHHYSRYRPQRPAYASPVYSSYQPAPQYQARAPHYRVRPRASGWTWSGSIQGSFRF
jgi:hypothetical protein